MTGPAGAASVGAARGAINALTLELGGEVFAIEAGRVREVLDRVAVTRVPRAPDFVGGLINVRGRVVPLADLRVKFDMPRTPPDENTRVVVLELPLGGEAAVVGIHADRVHTVTDIDLARMEDAPRVGMRWRPEYLRGVARHQERFVIIPDLQRIFSENAAENAETTMKGDAP